jgi:hypothetical protein
MERLGRGRQMVTLLSDLDDVSELLEFHAGYNIKKSKDVNLVCVCILTFGYTALNGVWKTPF